MTRITEGTRRREHHGAEVIDVVEVINLQWADHEWRAQVRLREGVYAEDRYTVVLTYLGPIPGDDADSRDLKAALRDVIKAVVVRQMRRGALPPRAMVVNWRRLADRPYPGDAFDAVRTTIARIDKAIGLVSQADTRGYFHAMAPVQQPKSAAPTGEMRVPTAAGR